MAIELIDPQMYRLRNLRHYVPDGCDPHERRDGARSHHVPRGLPDMQHVREFLPRGCDHRDSGQIHAHLDRMGVSRTECNSSLNTRSSCQRGGQDDVAVTPEANI